MKSETYNVTTTAEGNANNISNDYDGYDYHGAEESPYEMPGQVQDGTYKVEIIGWEEDLEYLTKTYTGLKNPEQIRFAVMTLLLSYAYMCDLGFESQGDQFMAYYHAGELDGMGAITAQIINESTGRIYWVG